MCKATVPTTVAHLWSQAQETHKAIREWIAKKVSPQVAAGIRVQYGGTAACHHMYWRLRPCTCGRPLAAQGAPALVQCCCRVGAAV